MSSNGALSLSNVVMSSTRAAGGGVADHSALVSGGGGMGGASGIFTPGGGGGLLSGSNAPGSGAGGGPNGGAAVAVAGVATVTGGAGGFASGGGGASSDSGTATGGAGGFGGGGGGANNGGTNTGGAGGYGGGGGSAATLSYATVGVGGSGGFGGGGGAGLTAGGTAGFGGGNGRTGPSSGGGGLGAGGAIFVQAGGTVTVQGDLSQSVSSVSGGTGFNNGGSGSAFGSGIFYQGNSGATSTLALGIGNQSIANDIADYIGSGGTNPGSGSNVANQGGRVALAKTGSGILTLSGSNTYSGGTTLNAGTLVIGNNNALGSGTLTMAEATTLSFTSTGNFTVANNITISGDPTFAPPSGTTQTISGVISDGSSPGFLEMVGPGTLVLSGANTYSGGTTVSGGTLQLSGAGTLGFATATLGVSGGVLDLGTTSQATGALTMTGGTIQNGMLASSAFDVQAGTISAVLAGSGALTKTGSGAVVLSGANTYSGGTMVSGGTVQLSGTGTLGAATGTTTVSGGILDLGNTTQTQSAVNLAGGTIQNGGLNASIASTGGTLNGIGGSASLTTTAGTTTLLGINSYSGATIVSGGTLDVEGSITGTSAVTMNAGGVLTGTGVVDPLVVTIASGGTLAPGNGMAGTSLAIEGNLVLSSGATYLVRINPTTASYTTVTGNANLGGATVNAAFASGSYVSKTYIILTAGSISQSFASDVVNTNLPANFSTSLSYDANNAYLNLVLNFAIPGGLNRNQQAVGNALTNFFNTNGSIPLTYGALTPAGLTQASGELGASAQQTTFSAMGQFMGLLTDPFAQQNGGPGAIGSVTVFAEEDQASAYAARKRTDAFAMITKAPPGTFEQRWSVWAAGFGGSQTTGGNAIVGSNDTTSRIFGTAAGADYRFSADTLAGFALAGGGTNFSVDNGLGSGHSDLFQAGAYLRHTNGPAYISAAVAYGWQDITTDRTVTIAGTDRLRAEFNANACSGRLEGGYRFAMPWIGGIGLTPYSAAQFTTFDLPAYAEQVVSGSSAFALSYASKSVTDTRSELGLRTDKSFALGDGLLTLRGRAGWARDFNPDRSVAATFQALPGASFVVNGAALARNSALTTASVEMKWTNGWSAAATFEGEFSNVTRSYAGKGSVRYAW
ncbi:autotransporter domain-containing protein [Bradyrhizobium diazoefficiens]|uniref:autotransporter domain-containing protein n=1 Tax=Bradyrhizobium diazoefficiens TaxID=1355477 RepID=UPI0024BF5D22|nr:autotransporter domain-containing protein [Bradyrhizobium diazoefficiens]